MVLMWQVLDCLPKGQYPGSVLVKLAVGNLREFAATAKHWEEEALRLRKRTSYLLRVHVYQVRFPGRVGCPGLRWYYFRLAVSLLCYYLVLVT